MYNNIDISGLIELCSIQYPPNIIQKMKFQLISSKEILQKEYEKKRDILYNHFDRKLNTKEIQYIEMECETNYEYGKYAIEYLVDLFVDSI